MAGGLHVEFCVEAHSKELEPEHAREQKNKTRRCASQSLHLLGVGSPLATVCCSKGRNKAGSAAHPSRCQQCLGWCHGPCLDVRAGRGCWPSFPQCCTRFQPELQAAVSSREDQEHACQCAWPAGLPLPPQRCLEVVPAGASPWMQPQISPGHSSLAWAQWQ